MLSKGLRHLITREVYQGCQYAGDHTAVQQTTVFCLLIPSYSLTVILNIKPLSGTDAYQKVLIILGCTGDVSQETHDLVPFRLTIRLGHAFHLVN